MKIKVTSKFTHNKLEIILSQTIISGKYVINGMITKYLETERNIIFKLSELGTLSG
jgi:hypothetical protein